MTKHMTQAEKVRHAFHSCKIGYFASIGELKRLGYPERKADDFLYCRGGHDPKGDTLQAIAKIARAAKDEINNNRMDDPLSTLSAIIILAEDAAKR